MITTTPLLVAPGSAPACPVCGRRLDVASYRPLPGAQGACVLTVRCPRKRCHTWVPLVLQVSAARRQLVHLAS